MAWLVALLIALAGVAGRPADAAPRAELWPRWQAHDPASSATIDYQAWGDFLARYVETDAHGIHRVAYAEVVPADRARLDADLDRLAAVAISSYPRTEQLAYWINLYNALTVQIVLEHYPVGSIRDIDVSPGLFSDGPWGKKVITVEGEPLSLDDIEHRILRPIWRDPRVHYALNCAALGCPNLQPRPFGAATLETQLDEAARGFVNHPRGVSIEGGELEVSSIYHWFEEDFGGDEAGVIAHLRTYAAPDLRAELDRFTAIDDHAYDWRLNDAGRR